MSSLPNGVPIHEDCLDLAARRRRMKMYISVKSIVRSAMLPIVIPIMVGAVTDGEDAVCGIEEGGGVGEFDFVDEVTDGAVEDAIEAGDVRLWVEVWKVVGWNDETDGTLLNEVLDSADEMVDSMDEAAAIDNESGADVVLAGSNEVLEEERSFGDTCVGADDGVGGSMIAAPFEVGDEEGSSV